MNYRKIFLFALISVVALNATAQDNDTYDEQLPYNRKKGNLNTPQRLRAASHTARPLYG